MDVKMDSETYRDGQRRKANARRFRALELRREGKTYREISVLVGRADQPEVPLSIERGRQLVLRAARMLLHPSKRDHPLRAYAMELRKARGKW